MILYFNIITTLIRSNTVHEYKQRVTIAIGVSVIWNEIEDTALY